MTWDYRPMVGRVERGLTWASGVVIVVGLVVAVYGVACDLMVWVGR